MVGSSSFGLFTGLLLGTWWEVVEDDKIGSTIHIYEYNK